MTRTSATTVALIVNPESTPAIAARQLTIIRENASTATAT